MEKELYAWTMLAVAALATYGWRYAAVLIGHRLNPNSPVFQWFGCVAYAIIGGLVARTLIFPVGMLAEVPIAYRLIAMAAHISSSTDSANGSGWPSLSVSAPCLPW